MQKIMKSKYTDYCQNGKSCQGCVLYFRNGNRSSCQNDEGLVEDKVESKTEVEPSN